jgi:ABC-2 type transport system permease protein
MDAIFYPAVFILLFTYVFGGAIGGSPTDYLQYAFPGIMCQTVVFMSMYTAITVNTDFSKGVMDRFRTLPVWGPAYLVGALTADILRYGLAVVLSLVAALLIGYRPAGGFFGVVAAVALMLLFTYALSWLWLILGLKARTPTAVSGLATIILFPLTFVSSAFVPLETMPAGLQVFVAANPITILIDACRGLLDGAPEWGGIGLVIGISVALTVVLAPIALRIYKSGTGTAR